MTQYSWGSNKYLNIFQTTITWIFGFKTEREGPTVHWKPVPDWMTTIRASRGHERSGGLQREYQEEEEGKERGREERGRRGKELERSWKGAGKKLERSWKGECVALQSLGHWSRHVYLTAACSSATGQSLTQMHLRKSSRQGGGWRYREFKTK